MVGTAGDDVLSGTEFAETLIGGPGDDQITGARGDDTYLYNLGDGHDTIINTAFADVVAKSELSVLDLASNYQALSDELRETVLTRIDDEYGLELPQLYIVNISVPAEVEQALDTRTSMNAIGDMATFQAYQLGQAMPVAAENPAGGLAGAGVGVGMGMAMANQWAQPGQPGPGGPGGGGMLPPPPPPPAAPPWHFVENGQSVGPVSPAQLAQAVTAGRVSRATLVWTAGMPAWSEAGSVPALATLFGSVPPPPPGG